MLEENKTEQGKEETIPNAVITDKQVEEVLPVLPEPERDNTTALHQAESYLKAKYEFRNNIIIAKIEKSVKGANRFVPMTDRDYNSLYRKLQKDGCKISINNLRNLLNSDFVETYNPFQQYFNSLPAWDGTTDYILELAKTVKTTDDDFWHDCFKRWIVAFVGCAIDDDIINHTVIVFAGKQGIGKTTWHLNLVPDSLKDYRYSGNIKPNNKDSIIHLSECILINLDELEALNRGELSDLKEMITKSTIRLRRPYGYSNEKYERRASFTGSVNKMEFLTDTTGTRRFLCFETTEIDYLRSINLDLVYSQALHLLKNGFKYWFDSTEATHINKKNEGYSVVSVEEELLMQTYQTASDQEEFAEALTTTEIAQILTARAKINLSNTFIYNLGKALNKRKFVRVKSKQLYRYLVKPVE